MKRLLSLAGLLTTLVLLTLTGHPQPVRAQAGARWVLLVGVEEYRSPHISRLSFAESDVADFAKALRQSGGFPAANVQVMTSAVRNEGSPDCPTALNILRRLDWFAGKVGPDDTFLFYDTGHGFSKDGKDFLGTYDTDPQDLESLQRTAVSLDDLKKRIARLKASRVVFIIDACRNDPERGKGDRPNLRTEAFSKSFVLAAQPEGSRITGSAVLFACQEGERSFEDPELKHSVLTYYLLEALKSGAGAPRADLTIDDVADYVARQVVDWAAVRGRQQSPDLVKLGPGKIVLAAASERHGVLQEGMPAAEITTIARLRVTSKSPGAAILIDGRDTGRVTPDTIEVDLGDEKKKDVEVGVRLGGKTKRYAASLERGRVTPVISDLEAESAGPAPSGSRRPGEIRINPKDGAEMVWVPAGEFTMGSASGDKNEKPVHKVRISRGFWLYRTEVTNAQYGRFLAADPGRRKPEFWNDPRFNAPRQPVVGVSWDDAAAYCRWAGGRLPSEAEWEYAARGADGRKYPWGNQEPAATRAVFRQAARKAAPGGSCPEGKSWCGALDLAGNVWEWCADWYTEGYYRTSPLVDPKGPASGIDRIQRGGAWDVDAYVLRAAFRDSLAPGSRLSGTGFRPVGDFPEEN